MRALLSIVLIAAGAAPVHAGDPPVLVVERIAAVVGETPILESAVRARLAVGGEATPGRAAVLNELIEEALITAEASRLSVTVPPEDVERALAEIKRSNGLDDAAFAAAMQAQGYDLASYREAIARQILKYRVVNVAVLGRSQVSEAEIETRYRQLGEQRPLEQIRDEIRTAVFQDKFAAASALWLAELRHAAYVEIR